MKMLWTSYNFITKENYYPDLTVGGIVDMKFYQFPEIFKEQKHWKIRNVFSVQDRLNYLPYPDAQSVSSESLNISYTLPDYVWISENPEIRVGLWDESTNQFSSELIDKLQFEKATRQLSFTS